MKPVEPKTLELEAVAEHFEAWRRDKKKGERIPDGGFRDVLLVSVSNQLVRQSVSCSKRSTSKRAVAFSWHHQEGCDSWSHGKG